jgi:hypothetical protein
MLLYVYSELTMAKLKSSRFSYSWEVNFPSTSIFNKTSKYEAEVYDYVVSFIFSSTNKITTIFTSLQIQLSTNIIMLHFACTMPK